MRLTGGVSRTTPQCVAVTRLSLTCAAFVAEGMTLLLLASGMRVDAMVPQDAPARTRAIPRFRPLVWRPPCVRSDAVRLDVDLSGRHVDHAPGPDFDRVHP